LGGACRKETTGLASTPFFSSLSTSIHMPNPLVFILTLQFCFCSLFFWLLFILFEIIYKLIILFLMTLHFFSFIKFDSYSFDCYFFYLFLDLFYFIFSFHPLLYYIILFYFYIIPIFLFLFVFLKLWIIENFSSWFLWVCLLLGNLI